MYFIYLTLWIDYCYINKINLFTEESALGSPPEEVWNIAVGGVSCDFQSLSVLL